MAVRTVTSPANFYTEVLMKLKVMKAGAIVAGIILLIFGSVQAYRTMYYSEREQILARLASIPDIEVINIYGRDDFFRYNVRFVDLRLKDRPESFIEIEVPARGILKDSEHIFLSRIGPWQLSSGQY